MGSPKVDLASKEHNMSGSRHKLLVLVMVGVIGSAGWASPPTYRLVDLGTVSKSDSASQALGINNVGQVVGWSDSSAFIWESGTMTDLGKLPGFSYGHQAWGINDNGTVVGYGHNGQTVHACIWHNGSQPFDLGTLGGTFSIARAVNNFGLVVGSSTNENGREHAFVWQNNQMTDIDVLGTYESSAWSVNSLGHVVGRATGSGGEHAFLWTPGGTEWASSNPQMRDIGSLGGQSIAFGINDQDHVVGKSVASDGLAYAFLWSAAGGIENLGTLGRNESAQAINNADQIVGFSYLDNQGLIPHATLWQEGATYDLNNLVTNRGGWELKYAMAISDDGWIAGVGANPSGETRAFLLTPEPATMSILALGLSALTARRARRIVDGHLS
jgi:probable HAF family extracellular repeat protein